MKTPDRPTYGRTVIRRGRDWDDEHVITAGRRRIGLRGRGVIVIRSAELIATGWFRLFPGAGTPRYIDVPRSSILWLETID